MYPEHADEWANARTRMRDRYLALLEDAGSPLLQAGESVRVQLISQLESVADDAAQMYPGEHDATLSETIGRSRAATGVHPSASLAAANMIFAACLTELSAHLARCGEPLPTEAAALRLNRAILSRMADAAANYVSYLLEKAGTAHREEARRLGRELHDAVGPVIAVGLQNLELVEYWSPIDPGKAREKIASGKQNLHEALTLVRSLAAETRLAVEPHEIASALRTFLDALPESITTKFATNDTLASLPPHYGNEIFLILREAARNAATHARPTTLCVDVAVRGNTLVATVRDDGTGFDPAQTTIGTGRASMAERAALIGAELNIKTTSDGTTVTLTVPLP